MPLFGRDKLFFHAISPPVGVPESVCFDTISLYHTEKAESTGFAKFEQKNPARRAAGREGGLWFEDFGMVTVPWVGPAGGVGEMADYTYTSVEISGPERQRRIAFEVYTGIFTLSAVYL